MKNYNISILILTSLFCFFSCITIGNENIKTDQNLSSVLDKAIIAVSETIIEKLPQNAKIALFNISEEETELTNFIIEDIASILIKKGGLKILERNKIESIEFEHNWQMETGYVSDDEIASITSKLGAEYVVSCYISGSGAFKRLRIKAWQLETGEVVVSYPFPIDELGEQSVKMIQTPYDKNTNVKILTIRENGIIVDCENDVSKTIQTVTFCVYIEGISNYFIIFLKQEDEDDSYTNSYQIISVDDNSMREMYSNIPKNSTNSGLTNIGYEDFVTGHLIEWGVDRRNVNFILSILTRVLFDIS